MSLPTVHVTTACPCILPEVSRANDRTDDCVKHAPVEGQKRVGHCVDRVQPSVIPGEGHSEMHEVCTPWACFEIECNIRVESKHLGVEA